MPDCASIDALVTPYVDGELSGAALDTVEGHVRCCPPCYSRVAAERAVRGLLRQKHEIFAAECAPPTLKQRCEAHRSCVARRGGPAAVARSWRRLSPLTLAAAAALLAAVGSAALIYTGTPRSDRLMAAELAADHAKCFALNAALHTHDSPQEVERAMAESFDWDVQLPAALEREGLELVGSRSCLYGGGRVAHVMYRHHGAPVSLFMLPGVARDQRIVEALGHECVIWSDSHRTFVLVARENRDDVERLARVAQASIH